MGWNIKRGAGRVVMATIHSGHDVRPEVARLQKIDDLEQVREEDPYLERLSTIAPMRISVSTSRFEVDLNRRRKKAVYLVPEHAFGLDLWNEVPSEEVLEASRSLHDRFYEEVTAFLDEVAAREPAFVVLDLHSYCHRRNGPDAEPANPEGNPEVNVGTGTVDWEHFGPVTMKFMDELKQFDFGGRSLDVRENVRFRGGYFSSYVNRRYVGKGCALAIEIKKTFMDEWTGELFPDRLELLRRALASTVPGLNDALAQRDLLLSA